MRISLNAHAEPNATNPEAAQLREEVALLRGLTVGDVLTVTILGGGLSVAATVTNVQVNESKSGDYHQVQVFVDTTTEPVDNTVATAQGMPPVTLTKALKQGTPSIP